jgi:hypothetical protein
VGCISLIPQVILETVSAAAWNAARTVLLVAIPPLNKSCKKHFAHLRKKLYNNEHHHIALTPNDSSSCASGRVSGTMMNHRENIESEYKHEIPFESNNYGTHDKPDSATVSLTHPEMSRTSSELNASVNNDTVDSTTKVQKEESVDSDSFSKTSQKISTSAWQGFDFSLLRQQMNNSKQFNLNVSLYPVHVTQSSDSFRMHNHIHTTANH